MNASSDPRSKILLDFAMFLPLGQEGAVANEDEYLDLLDLWGSDARCRFGFSGYELLLESLGKMGYPEAEASWFTGPGRREAQRLLATVLQRVEFGIPTLTLSGITPASRLTAENLDVFLSDLAFALEQEIDAIATIKAHWAVGSSVGDSYEVKACGHDLAIEAIVDPDVELGSVSSKLIRAYYADKSLKVFGGKEPDHWRGEAGSALGIRTTRIDWYESEQKKPPRSVKTRLSKLDPDSTVVIVVTGKIGHSTSGTVVKALSGRERCLELVEHESDLIEALCRRALRIGGSESADERSK